MDERILKTVCLGEAGSRMDPDGLAGSLSREQGSQIRLWGQGLGPTSVAVCVCVIDMTLLCLSSCPLP